MIFALIFSGLVYANPTPPCFHVLRSSTHHASVHQVHLAQSEIEVRTAGEYESRHLVLTFDLDVHSGPLDRISHVEVSRESRHPLGLTSDEVYYRVAATNSDPSRLSGIVHSELARFRLEFLIDERMVNLDAHVEWPEPQLALKPIYMNFEASAPGQTPKWRLYVLDVQDPRAPRFEFKREFMLSKGSTLTL